MVLLKSNCFLCSQPLPTMRPHFIADFCGIKLQLLLLIFCSIDFYFMFISLFLKVNSQFLASLPILFDTVDFLQLCVTNKFPLYTLFSPKKLIYESIKQNQPWR